MGEFQYSDMRFELPVQPNAKDTVTLDRYRHLQALASDEDRAGDGAAARPTRKFENRHLDLLNKRAIYHRVLERKRRFSWHNLSISQDTVDTLLARDDWYNLYIPPEKFDFSNYGRVREWENLAVDLISEYANRYWRRERNEWEGERMEIVPLDDNNLNYVEQYELAVDEEEEALIKGIEELVERVKSGDYTRKPNQQDVPVPISLLTPGFHAYIPLLHANSQELVQISPVPLNDGEKNFVADLKKVVESMAVESMTDDFLKDKKIYLMRNMSRGKGISFFEDYSFYPDFILWVQDSRKQDILFIDPKGLERYNSKIQSKVDLHKRIKETEKKIQTKNPEISLHSYIWSHTQPKNIGTDEEMSRDECHAEGIFIASRKSKELTALLRHALT